MLQVYHSNRLETLIEELARVCAAPPSDPFRPETIVVQNQGMARWIAQQLAQRNGISAHLDFLLPANFFWQALEAWLPDVPDATLFDKGTLVWRVHKLLPNLLGEQAFKPLARYLTDDTFGLKRFQLAQRIADLFDQYLVFRPDLVLDWEQGAGEHWQALLWRALCSAGSDGAHRARLLLELEAAMKQSGHRQDLLSERVCLFGLSALAPVYVHLLGALAREIPLHLFFLNPCREYWSDLVDVRGRAHRRAKAQRAGLPDPTGLLDLGNPLLASLGHTGQVFLDQLLELGGIDHDRFVAPAGDNLLQQVQHDLLELVDTPDEDQRRLIAADDRSIQLHSTHGPLREIQVLHDQLLDLFERLDGLKPRDIIVMAPDIDRYAAYVEAIFGAAEASMYISWSIADRRMAAEQPLLAALKLLLALPRSRFEASELLSLLEVSAVRRRFGLEDEGLERIRVWVRESGVRWGEDGAMRIGLGLPEERANTWSFGLDRLFLGYTLPPHLDADPYAGVLPYGDVEGREVEYLGILQTFIEIAGTWRKRLAAPRVLADWRLAISELITAFFALDDEEEARLQQVRDGIDEQVSKSAIAELDQPVSLDVIGTLLRDLLEDTGGAQRFLSGGVTFCNMVPMRSIPFRVVCLIGMNGADFPRTQRPLSFDLMARHPRRGDRSRRRDDRYLFLEALLSAREVLYLSWVGNDQRDNSIKVPSIVVDELLDYMRRSYRPADGKDLDDQLLVRHPLQPFSRRYYDGSDRRLFSYGRTWLDGVRSKMGAQIPPFFDADLEAPDDDLRTLDIEDLSRFLCNPTQYFLTQRLGLCLPQEAEKLEDTEPFDASGLERYQLRQSLLQGLLADRDRDAILDRLRGEGRLPHGLPGELLLDEQLREAEPFLARLRRRMSEELEPIEVDLPLAGFRLQGQLGNLQPSGLLDYRFGDLKAKDRLRAWIRHLVLNLLMPTEVEPASIFVAMDQTLVLDAIKNPVELLADLLELRWQGLCKPLSFFPESALAWVQKGYGAAFDQAWSDDHNPMREQGQIGVRIAFHGRNPIGTEFEAIASRILRPMLDHSETLKAEKDL